MRLAYISNTVGLLTLNVCLKVLQFENYESVYSVLYFAIMVSEFMNAAMYIVIVMSYTYLLIYIVSVVGYSIADINNLSKF